MGDFPGHAQIAAVMTRLRSELAKTVLEAAAPRTFDSDWLPTGGGYGLTLPATDIPEHWGSERNPGGAIDALCPVLEAWRFADLDQGTQIDETHLADSGFTWPDIAGQTDVATGANWRGSGYILIEQESAGESVENQFSGTRRAEEVLLTATVRVPAGFGQGQGQLYCGLLARVLGETQNAAGVRAAHVIALGGSDHLQFGWAPELGRIAEKAKEWLTLVWTIQATRYYDLP